MSSSSTEASAAPHSVYDFRVRTIDGDVTTLQPYRGKVLLVVNVARRCGFTPKYRGLEALYRKYSAAGLVVLGFPCNQFGRQEPGSEAEIKAFCADRYAVSFPMFAKIEVNGAGTHPLYSWLKSQAKGVMGSASIKWNFTKFLVDRAGRVVRRFAPNTKPEKLEAQVVKLLG